MPAGIGALRRALPGLLETPDLPGWAREVFTDLAHRLRTVDERIAVYDRRGEAVARQTEPAQRLLQAPGIGPVTATALVATVGNAHAFTNGRQVAAWLGPRQHSSGGTRRLGRITTRGHVYLRTLLIHGARAAPMPPAAGSRRSTPDGASTKPWWRWPPRTLASCGRCWPRDGPISPLRRASERTRVKEVFPS